MRLQKGKFAPPFKLPTIDQHQLSLQDLKGKKVLMVLNRWANCPFCSLTLNRIVNNSAKFNDLGVAIIMIFPSTLEKIKKSLPKLDVSNIYFLSDENLSVYQTYGAEASIAGEMRSLLDLPNLAQALKHMKANSIFYDGKFTQLPCSILINEMGIIDEVNYGKTFTDIIDPKEVLRWAENVKNSKSKALFNTGALPSSNGQLH